ncbi:MAG TPA: hypothetical protein VNN76_03780 [Bacteroidota bacterium]|nr:hypothetical protein [Bacteroidota bacterium]
MVVQTHPKCGTHSKKLYASSSPISPLTPSTLSSFQRKKDLRAGYGSPTVLVNGKDLFGAPVPSTYEAACRIYRGGVPGSKEILGKLKALKW